MRGAFALLLAAAVGVVALCRGSPMTTLPGQASEEPAGGGGTGPLRPVGGGGAAPCRTPLQWEGRFSEWNHNAGTNNRYTISYDGVKRRKWVEEEEKSLRPGRRFYKFLILFDEQVEYQIDLKYDRCTKIPLGPWRNFSIPPTAIVEDQYQIGGPEATLDVTEWSNRQPARSKETWIGGFTDVGCWPVFEIFTYSTPNETMGFTTRFFDLTAGIKDMSVFDVPALCRATGAETPAVPASAPGFWERLVPDWLRDLLAGPKRHLGGGDVGVPVAEAEPRRRPDAVPDVGVDLPVLGEVPARMPVKLPPQVNRPYNRRLPEFKGIP